MLVIGDREALAWILSTQRMAFPGHRARSVAVLRPGDNLLLYTTRGCFRNPSRDRGRVMGHATVTSAVSPLDVPVKFVDRTFPVGCALSIESLAQYGTGVDLADQVSRMHAFPNPMTWSVYLRRPVVPLDGHDYALLHRALRKIAFQPASVVPEYVVHGTPPRISGH